MRVRRFVMVAPVVGLLVMAFAPPASAMPPSKAGWWNVAALGGAALPMPTTAAGDLHVGQSPGGPTAYAAVSYDLAGLPVSSATLELKVTSGKTVGTPALQACLTKDDSWKAAEDGAITDAPAYDCSKNAVFGVVSATGDTVTFLLDAAQQLSGHYSLAIVPSASSTAFQVDLTKPGPESLTVVEDTAAQSPTTSTYVPPATTPDAAGTSGTAPLGAGTAPLAPSAPLAAAPAPAVAAPIPAPQAAAAPNALPAAASLPVKPLSNRDRYEAGTLLALIAGGLVWALQQPRTTPRLIGGMSRTSGVVPEPVPDGPARGIGRFTFVRATPARRLV